MLDATSELASFSLRLSYKLNFSFLKAIELQGTPSQHSWVAGAGTHAWSGMGDSQVRKDSQGADIRAFAEPTGASIKAELLHGEIV